MYEDIVGQPLERRGKTSWGFPVTSDSAHGPPTRKLITIQAAFIRPDWTLIFCDHNVMSTFHIMKLGHPCNQSDVSPGGTILEIQWRYIWSSTHGPVPHHIKNGKKLLFVTHEMDQKLDKFRATVLAKAIDRGKKKGKKDMRSIYYVVKSDPEYFNGLGAQEACDMLVRIAIHPLMPTHYVCKSYNLWKQFKDAVLNHFDFTYRLIFDTPDPPFSHVSCGKPFKMNTDGHRRYIRLGVLSYRRPDVFVDQAWLDRAHSLNLFDSNSRIGKTGKAL
ncbi:fatty acid synthase alpha subunit Lsd1, partial [Marasmius sp. AFHP31]